MYFEQHQVGYKNNFAKLILEIFAPGNKLKVRQLISAPSFKGLLMSKNRIQKTCTFHKFIIIGIFTELTDLTWVQLTVIDLHLYRYIYYKVKVFLFSLDLNFNNFIFLLVLFRYNQHIALFKLKVYNNNDLIYTHHERITRNLKNTFHHIQMEH